MEHHKLLFLQILMVNHPYPQVQRKMEVLYLKSQGVQQEEILRLSGIRSRM